jgi:hypothetical protein
MPAFVKWRGEQLLSGVLIVERLKAALSGVTQENIDMLLQQTLHDVHDFETREPL